MKTKHGKCPHCLPTGGAILTATYDDDFGKVWKCNNCGVTQSRRTNSPTLKVTPSQKAVIERLQRAGWELETKFIGRKVWVVGKKERGNVLANLYSGDSFYGTIGPRGAFSLKLQRIGGEKLIESEIDICVYLD